jgi:hypothetical protein
LASNSKYSSNKKDGGEWVSEGDEQPESKAVNGGEEAGEVGENWPLVEGDIDGDHGFLWEWRAYN